MKEASTKLGKWWKEVTEMQSEVKKFQTEANDKAVDELVHLERVKDLLVELKKQVPLEEPPKQWGYSGDVGPQYWGDLDPTYKTCGALPFPMRAAVRCSRATPSESARTALVGRSCIFETVTVRPVRAWESARLDVAVSWSGLTRWWEGGGSRCCSEA